MKEATPPTWLSLGDTCLWIPEPPRKKSGHFNAAMLERRDHVGRPRGDRGGGGAPAVPAQEPNV